MVRSARWDLVVVTIEPLELSSRLKRTPVIALTPVSSPFVVQSLDRSSSGVPLTDSKCLNARKKGLCLCSLHGCSGSLTLQQPAFTWHVKTKVANKKVHETAESRHACRSLNDLFIYQPIDFPLVEALGNKEPEFTSILHFSIRESSSPPTVAVLRKRVQEE